MVLVSAQRFDRFTRPSAVQLAHTSACQRFGQFSFLDGPAVSGSQGVLVQRAVSGSCRRRATLMDGSQGPQERLTPPRARMGIRLYGLWRLLVAKRVCVCVCVCVCACVCVCVCVCVLDQEFGGWLRRVGRIGRGHGSLWGFALVHLCSVGGCTLRVDCECVWHSLV